MLTLTSHLQAAQQRLQQQDRWRERNLRFGAQQVQTQLNGLPYLQFSSNDYLGLANHPQLQTAYANVDGAGAGASPLVTGHQLCHHLLEDEIADWLGTERAVLATSGFVANYGVITALARAIPKLHLVADKWNHASLVDGVLAATTQGATSWRYRHGDVVALTQRLQHIRQHHGLSCPILVISDTVFSMDGDEAPLAEIAQLCQQYDTWLLIDEAHALGVMGQRGSGALNKAGVTWQDHIIITGTFGKSLGTGGAFIAGSIAVMETMLNFNRAYIYSTAMPPPIVAATRTGLTLLKQANDARIHLQHLIQTFHQTLSEDPVLSAHILPSTTPIQGLILGSSALALAAQHELREVGIWINAMRPPTVPTNRARLRITFSAQHQMEDVQRLCQALQTQVVPLIKAEMT